MSNKTKGTLPSGSIRYRLYIGTDPTGKKLYKSFTAATKSAAKKMAEQWQKDHANSASNAQNPTFSEAAAVFLANRSKTLSPRTYGEYLRIVAWLEDQYPTFTRSHMSVITSETVQALINDMVARKKGNAAVAAKGRTIDKTISPKTVVNYFGLIQTILQTQGITLHGIKLPQKAKAELNIPENETVTRLLATIKGTELETPVLLAAWGPMRRGEICALTLDDIDLATRTVSVTKAMVRNADGEWVVKLPKSAAGTRTITYPQYVIDLIRAKGYIYRGTPDTLSRRFVRTLSRHGFEHFRFHDLRHFAASFQIALGIPPEYVMERGGWHSPGTMQRYVHALDKQRREMADKANDAFAQLL
jgi:integrase